MSSVVLQPSGIVGEEPGTRIAVADGRVVAVGCDLESTAIERLDGTLLPGLIDLQVNGAGGRSVDEATPEALDVVAATVARGGAAGFLPTLITTEWSQLLDQIRAVADWIESRKARSADYAAPLGIHVEGPFLEVSGAHEDQHFRDPTPDRVDALLDAAQGHLALLTLAPGRRGAAEATAQLVAQGVAVSIGHASRTDGFSACVDAGASCVTHLFNAMSPLRHRAPGIAGRALDDPRLSCALIIDGIHLDPAVVRIAYRCLGPERTLIVTDSVAAAGMPDGDYTLAGMRVHLEEGVVRDDVGTIAGSALTMQGAATGFLETIQGADANALAQVAARNPARLIGRDDWGRIAAGAVARFTLLAADGTLRVITP